MSRPNHNQSAWEKTTLHLDPDTKQKAMGLAKELGTSLSRLVDECLRERIENHEHQVVVTIDTLSPAARNLLAEFITKKTITQ